MRRLPVLLLSLLSITAAHRSWGQVCQECQDLDGDGHCSAAGGGDDCQDVQSAYKESSAWGCVEAAAPTMLLPPPVQGSDQAIHDHSWIQADTGTYHLFAHSVTPTPPGGIRHFVSTDLTSLQAANPAVVLTATPGAWDDDLLWAPYVIKHQGTYYMFYTGVDFGPDNSLNTSDDRYRIGVATSQDLASWVKAPSWVYDCSDAPFSQGSNRCRDPFVMFNQASGKWLLFATGQLVFGVTPGPTSEGVVVAQASSLLGPWTTIGYVKATKTLPQGVGIGSQITPLCARGLSENPFVASFHNRFYLFFKDWRDPESNSPGSVQSMIQYAVSDTLDFDDKGSANWAYRGSIPDPGVSAAEIIQHGGDTWILSAYISNCHAEPGTGTCAADFTGTPQHSYWLRLKRIVWDDAGGFVTRNLTKLSCRVPAAAIYPYANEPCDGVDQDCNPVTTGCGGRPPGEPTEE